MGLTADSRTRWFLAAFSAAMVTLPFLLVKFPPAVDLPEHVAQVHLFGEALRHPGGPYRVQWLTPYTAVMILFGLLRLVVGPLALGRAGLLTLGLLWTAATHWLAAKRGRSPEAAVLATALFFGLSTSWGFCSFLIGWPAFLVWFEVTTRPVESFGPKDALVLLGLAALLWTCHALWFATGIGWLLVWSMIQRPPRRVLLGRLFVLAPLVLLGVVWWFTLPGRNNGFTSALWWKEAPSHRLSLTWIAQAIFYGPKGNHDLVAATVILIWCVLSMRWATKSMSADRPLLLLSQCMLMGLFVLPNRVGFTIFLPERFAAMAVAALLLALPGPPFSIFTRRILATSFLFAFCTTTALAWQLNEQNWMSGFQGAVAALPDRSRLLELDLIHMNAEMQAPVFMHLSGYAQAAKENVVTSVSFAEAPSMPVVLKNPRRPWTRGLDMFAEGIKPPDFSYFDYALVGADDRAYKALVGRMPLTPVTTSGRWRLFKVTAH